MLSIKSNNKNLFALVDCNNFYVSCERVFNPFLLDQPVAVLSNNDGCIIARSNEVKALGIPMGAPFHHYKHILIQKGVHIYSSNYQLYGDMSGRVMDSLKIFSPDVEVYSIDEAFMDLSNFSDNEVCLLYTSPSPRDLYRSRMPSSA